MAKHTQRKEGNAEDFEKSVRGNALKMHLDDFAIFRALEVCHVDASHRFTICHLQKSFGFAFKVPLTITKS